jgi:hypothetical protein
MLRVGEKAWFEDLARVGSKFVNSQMRIIKEKTSRFIFSYLRIISAMCEEKVNSHLRKFLESEKQSSLDFRRCE